MLLYLILGIALVAIALRSFKIIVYAALALLLVSACTGCAEPPAAEPVAVSLLVGNHANARELPLNSRQVDSCLMEAATSFGTVSIIVVDGQPYCAGNYQISAPAKEGLSDATRKRLARDQVAQIQQVLRYSAARTAEVDALEALRLAARPLREAENTAKYLLVLDSGLSTCGYLNFTNNLLEAEPQYLCEQLAARSAIPDLNGVAVIWFGLGDTAAPQENLSPRQLQNLKEIWSQILTAAGAKSFSFAADLPGQPIADRNLPAVSEVFLTSEPEIIAGGKLPEITAFDEGRVAFIGDSSEFLDKQAALEVMRPFAEYLKAHPDFQALLMGTTARGRQDFCQRLSQARAEAVKAALVEMGANPAQIETRGLGWDNAFYVYDLNPDGALYEANAAKNRKVLLVNAATYKP